MNDILQEIYNRLKEDANLQLEWIGEGKGAFLFAQLSNRGVEVSKSHEGTFVEYWDNMNEPSKEIPVKEEVLPSVAEVCAHVLEWLHG